MESELVPEDHSADEMVVIDVDVCTNAGMATDREIIDEVIGSAHNEDPNDNIIEMKSDAPPSRLDHHKISSITR